MRKILLAMMLCSTLAARAALAAEAEWQISPRGGVGDLDVVRFQGVPPQFQDADTFFSGCNIGLLTPAGLLIEAGIDSSVESDFFGAFDSYTLVQQFAAVGYQLELGDGWRFVPKFGRTYWNLESKEGALFHSGPQETDEISGYDYYWEANVSRRISSVVTLGVSFKEGRYEFGRARSTSFVITLGF